ncbi:hypothetical protein ACOQFV_24770 [Nocardiopsis changdeensis]|uniref:DUF4175 domain-containing protein n=1 Tax=Nocardiopsis changdeensis TaxID=2831969 RepID=A0A975KTJ3_9ACTN|nr:MULTISPECIES: hypothetical protein [Nocardiopsis]QUX26548.1 hypothetical protein KGD84_33150 [Nocardiopsis changdeensis]QYX40667.1 hypothetical protein K1J57_32220 [Nocardiopsis sp. MT53]
MSTDRLLSVLHRHPWLWSGLGGAIGLGFLLAVRLAPVVSGIALMVLGAAFLVFVGWYLFVTLWDLRGLYRPEREDSDV